MQKDLVIKLADFGFTTNQAKVYLSIIESGSISVAKIAQHTQLHVQDIYKILPKLEKMGLITKTLEKPVLIKAIPIEESLTRYVDFEREEATKRIGHLEKNLKDLTDSIKDIQLNEPLNEEIAFVHLITAKQIKNQADITFGRALESCDLVVTLSLIKPLMSRLSGNIERFNSSSVKIRLIIESSSTPECARSLLQKALPPQTNITVKHLKKTNPVPYYVIDKSEVWISMEKETEVGLPCVLWTNGKNVARLFQESFEQSWKKSNAVKIYPFFKAREIAETMAS